MNFLLNISLVHLLKIILNDIPTMSIDAIALSCHTSKSQISKYVKSLGYETMKDFKEDCLDNISGMERTNKILIFITK